MKDLKTIDLSVEQFKSDFREQSRWEKTPPKSKEIPIALKLPWIRSDLALVSPKLSHDHGHETFHAPGKVRVSSELVRKRSGQFLLAPAS